jgi:hypothetical protein
LVSNRAFKVRARRSAAFHFIEEMEQGFRAKLMQAAGEEFQPRAGLGLIKSGFCWIRGNLNASQHRRISGAALHQVWPSVCLGHASRSSLDKPVDFRLGDEGSASDADKPDLSFGG